MTTTPTASPELPDLDKLEALARAATPGTWLHRKDPGNFGAMHCVKLPGERGEWVCDCVDNADVSTVGGVAGERNAAFIAAANPAAVLELIALARRAALANQPAPTVPAGDALRVEAGKLAPILRGMCEGGDVHGDGVDIYADDYMAGDGDTYVVRAAALLEQVAALAHQPAQEQAEQKRWANEQFLTAARVALVSMAHAAEKHGIYQTDYERFSAAVEKFAQQEPVAAPTDDLTDEDRQLVARAMERLRKGAAGECRLPPAGWHCTRKPGHDGPCAAEPVAAPQQAAAPGNSPEIPDGSTSAPGTPEAPKGGAQLLAELLGAPSLYSQVYVAATVGHGWSGPAARDAADAAVQEYGDSPAGLVEDLQSILDEVLRVDGAAQLDGGQEGSESNG